MKKAATKTTYAELVSEWYDSPFTDRSSVILKDSKILFKNNNDSHKDLSISKESVFHTDLMSNKLIILGISLLAEQGKLSLIDDIRKYFPELPHYVNEITIKHLIFHTSGLRDYPVFTLLSGIDLDSIENSPIKEADILNMLCRQKKLDFNPGEKLVYYNLGYFLLGLIVKRVSGKPLHIFAREFIFDLLELIDNGMEMLDYGTNKKNGRPSS
ncbi:MAG: serine hydrolase domain-containing protein [Promethearchaeota archaeon]